MIQLKGKCLIIRTDINWLGPRTYTMKHIWGIDLGGTKIEGVIIELNATSGNNKTLARLRVPTEAKEGYEHILSQINKLIELLKSDSGLTPKAIGIGTPGATDPHTGLLKNSNTLCLNAKPLQNDLEALLKIPVRLANDANCFALAEARLGIVQQILPHAEVVFGVIMGTGVGGGLVVNGKIINGSQGIGGEWGHNFLDESGGPCYCGKVGCVEKVIAGPSLERYYQEIGGEKGLNLKQILEKYEAGTDALATQTIERLLQMFGKAISVLINILDPDVIVLGGGVGNIDLLYTLGVQEAAKYVFNNRLDTIFAKPALGDSAGVFGAAALVEGLS